METFEVNITKKTQEKYKRHLEIVEQLLLDINWVVDKVDFDKFINIAIHLRDEIKDIEIELIIDKLRKKIHNGGRIETTDLNKIEDIGWKVPTIVWTVIKGR